MCLIKRIKQYDIKKTNSKKNPITNKRKKIGVK